MEMSNTNLESKIIISTSLLAISLILLLSFVHSNHAFAAEKFSVEAKIDLKSLSHPDKLKVVASANGETGTKYLTGNDLNSIKRTKLLRLVAEMSTLYVLMPLIH